MLCVTTVQSSISMNGNVLAIFHQKEGSDREIPYHPAYLSLMQKASPHLLQMLNEMVSSTAPRYADVLFVDDNFFFFRATASECTIMKKILHTYEQDLGQATNLQKSSIFFSKNVLLHDREVISTLLRVSTPLNTGQYLGLPSLIGRSKREVFAFLRDKLHGRIQGWQVEKFS